MPTVRRVPPRQVAVEGGASGAVPFDGNHTNDTMSWMFANDNWDEGEVPVMLDELMRHTVFGHLAWVVFVPEGYRL